MRQPARRPGEQLPRPPSATAPARTRARRQNGQSYAQSNPKSTSYHHRGNHFGLTTKRASRKRPNPCRNPISAGPASSLCVSYGPCSSVPASGCHHRPVPETIALKSRRSGTRKTRTKFAFTLSGRSADNLEPQGPPEPSPMPSIRQLPITNLSERSRLPMITARPPPLPPRRPRPPEIPSCP